MNRDTRGIPAVWDTTVSGTKPGFHTIRHESESDGVHYMSTLLPATRPQTTSSQHNPCHAMLRLPSAYLCRSHELTSRRAGHKPLEAEGLQVGSPRVDGSSVPCWPAANNHHIFDT